MRLHNLLEEIFSEPLFSLWVPHDVLEETGYEIRPKGCAILIKVYGACFRADEVYDLYDLYDLAHVTGWGPSTLHDAGRAFWVGSVLYRWSCTAFHNDRIGSIVDDIYDISVADDLCPG